MSILKICNKSIKHFSYLLNKSSCDAIFIGVKGGGCNGLKYFIKPTNEKEEKLDEVIIKDGVKIIVCGSSIMHLIGSDVSWKEDFMGCRVEIINPNATGKCGCGESWSI